MELKGRAMARGVMKAGRAVLGAAALQWGLWLLWGTDFPPLDVACRVIAWCALLSLGVLAAWNACAWLGDGEVRRERSLEKGRPELAAALERERAALRVLWRPELPERLITACDESGRPLMRAGALRGSAFGNLRYIGPPPVFTPCEAEVTRVTQTRERKKGVVTTTTETVRERRLLPDGRHYGWCDGCGEEIVLCGMPRAAPHAHVCEKCASR